jgi:hypothetical protein
LSLESDVWRHLKWVRREIGLVVLMAERQSPPSSTAFAITLS